MKQVRAKSLGYYNNARIKEGQVFYIKDDKHFSKEWMENVSEEQTHRVAQNPSKKKPSYIVDDSDEVI